MNMPLRVLPLIGLALAAHTGCNKDQPPAKSPANGAEEASKAAGTEGQKGGAAGGAVQGPGIQSSTLHVSEDIAKACQLPEPKPNANFAFDSANIADDDKDLLSALAKCLSSGALKGRRISLVGRADPRGEEEYNMSLGGARADSVGRYLKGLGVEEDRVSTTSRGELDASGKDEEGWARDRRVDIVLAN